MPAVRPLAIALIVFAATGVAPAWAEVRPVLDAAGDATVSRAVAAAMPASAPQVWGDRLAGLTPEQRQQMREQIRDQWQNRPQEERQRMREEFREQREFRREERQDRPRLRDDLREPQGGGGGGIFRRGGGRF